MENSKKPGTQSPDPKAVIARVEAKRRRNRKKQRQMRLYLCLAALAVIIIIAVICVCSCSGKEAPADVTQTQTVSAATAEPTPEPTPGPTAQPEVYLNVITEGPTDRKAIAITIDDLNEVDNLNTIITIAETYGAKLTLFPVGSKIIEKAELQTALRRAYSLGFEIENHTYNHGKIYSMTDGDMASEIYMCQMAVNKALGVNYEMHFLRMPGGNGEYDLRTHQYLVQLGTYKGIANWSYSGTDASLTNIKKNLKNGAIYLFHAKDDVKKLKEFIPYAISQGYEIVTLNELLGYEENAVTPLTADAMSYEIPEPLPFVYENYVTLGSRKYSKLYAVQILQQRLIDLGYLADTAKVDGDYGDSTQYAVKLFQYYAGLETDGYAGQATQQLLFSDEAAYNPDPSRKGGLETPAPAEAAAQ